MAPWSPIPPQRTIPSPYKHLPVSPKPLRHSGPLLNVTYLRGRDMKSAPACEGVYCSPQDAAKSVDYDGKRLSVYACSQLLK